MDFFSMNAAYITDIFRILNLKRKALKKLSKIIMKKIAKKMTMTMMMVMMMMVMMMMTMKKKMMMMKVKITMMKRGKVIKYLICF